MHRISLKRDWMIHDILVGCRCGAPATMQCPKCRELKIATDYSVFCAQACFKLAWAEHKAIHKAPFDTALYVLDSGRSRCKEMPTFSWTGSLRPSTYAHSKDIWSRCLLLSATPVKCMGAKLVNVEGTSDSMTGVDTTCLSTPSLVCVALGCAGSEQLHQWQKYSPNIYCSICIQHCDHSPCCLKELRCAG